MDAYDMSDLLKILWSRHYDKHSGLMKKESGNIKVCVNIDGEIKQIAGMEYNSDGYIELKLK